MSDVLLEKDLGFAHVALLNGDPRDVQILIEDKRGPGWIYEVVFPEPMAYKAEELVETATDEQDVETILREWAETGVWQDYQLFARAMSEEGY